MGRGRDTLNEEITNATGNIDSFNQDDLIMYALAIIIKLLRGVPIQHKRDE